MERISLDNRLSAVARWVIPGEPLADIGTDHALLPCMLVGSGRCPSAVAADVAPGPLQQATQTVDSCGLRQRISLRLGSGLTVLCPGETATAVLAGMGGRLICKLLQESPQVTVSLRRLVLQPQRNQEAVRSWLADNGWRIIGDDLARDDYMWYNIIAAEPGSMRLDGIRLRYGPYTRGVDAESRRQWLRCRRDSVLTIALSLQGRTGSAAERRRELENEAELLDKLIDEVK